jgi:hypothetical protein
MPTFSLGIDGDHFDASGYPAAPILWLTCILDIVTLSLVDWRPYAPTWLQAKVPPLLPNLPKLLTYQDYLLQSNTERSLSSLFTYCFQTPSTALADVTSPTALCVLFILLAALRVAKRTFLPVFANWGRVAGRKTHGPEWEKANHVRIMKFGEYVYRLLFHVMIATYGVYYNWDLQWWSPSHTLRLFQGYPYHPIGSGMIWYYLFQATYNLDALISLLEISFDIQWRYKYVPVLAWSPTVRGDFREMALHHAVTNLLLLGSSVCRLTRYGSITLLVHDLSDVPVDMSKLANFLKYKKTTIGCFIAMVVVWCVTRLCIMPFTLYRAVLTESHHLLDTGLDPILYVCYRDFFYVSLGLLILLHFTWFSMFLKIGYTMVTKNEVHDYSEHKNGEKDSGAPYKKNRSDEKKVV